MSTYSGKNGHIFGESTMLAFQAIFKKEHLRIGRLMRQSNLIFQAAAHYFRMRGIFLDNSHTGRVSRHRSFLRI